MEMQNFYWQSWTYNSTVCSFFPSCPYNCKIICRHFIITFLKFKITCIILYVFPLLQLRITIWSLSDQNVYHINLPKPASPGIDFSVGGSYMAVVERRMAQDCVAIYSCDTWTQVTVSFKYIYF